MQRDTRMLGNSRMFSDSRMPGASRMLGDSRIYGGSEMQGNFRMLEGSRIPGNSRQHGGLRMQGETRMYPDSRIPGDMRMLGDSRMFPESRLPGERDSSLYLESRLQGNSGTLGNSRMPDVVKMYSESRMQTAPGIQDGIRMPPDSRMQGDFRLYLDSRMQGQPRTGLNKNICDYNHRSATDIDSSFRGLPSQPNTRMNPQDDIGQGRGGYSSLASEEPKSNTSDMSLHSTGSHNPIKKSMDLLFNATKNFGSTRGYNSSHLLAPSLTSTGGPQNMEGGRAFISRGAQQRGKSSKAFDYLRSWRLKMNMPTDSFMVEKGIPLVGQQQNDTPFSSPHSHLHNDNYTQNTAISSRMARPDNTVDWDFSSNSFSGGGSFGERSVARFGELRGNIHADSTSQTFHDIDRMDDSTWKWGYEVPDTQNSAQKRSYDLSLGHSVSREYGEFSMQPDSLKAKRPKLSPPFIQGGSGEYSEHYTDTPTDYGMPPQSKTPVCDEQYVDFKAEPSGDYYSPNNAPGFWKTSSFPRKHSPDTGRLTRPSFDQGDPNQSSRHRSHSSDMRGSLHRGRSMEIHSQRRNSREKSLELSARRRSPRPQARGRSPGPSSLVRSSGPVTRGRSPGLSSRGRSPKPSTRGKSPGPPVRGRSPGHTTRGRSPGHIARGRSPGHVARGRSPGHSGRGRSPGHSARGRSPGHSARGRSPGHSARARSPGHSARARSPGHSARARSPGHSARARSPGPSARGRSPGPSARGRSPGPSARGRSPGPSARGRSPGLPSRGRSSEQPAGVRSPRYLARGRSPGSYTRGRSPGPTTGRRSLGPSARGRSPGPSARGRSPGPSARGRSPGPSARGRSPGPSARGRSPRPYESSKHYGLEKIERSPLFEEVSLSPRPSKFCSLGHRGSQSLRSPQMRRRRRSLSSDNLQRGCSPVSAQSVVEYAVDHNPFSRDRSHMGSPRTSHHSRRSPSQQNSPPLHRGCSPVSPEGYSQSKGRGNPSRNVGRIPEKTRIDSEVGVRDELDPLNNKMWNERDLSYNKSDSAEKGINPRRSWTGSNIHDAIVPPSGSKTDEKRSESDRSGTDTKICTGFDGTPERDSHQKSKEEEDDEDLRVHLLRLREQKVELKLKKLEEESIETEFKLWQLQRDESSGRQDKVHRKHDEDPYHTRGKGSVSPRPRDHGRSPISSGHRDRHTLKPPYRKQRY
ncbi:serine/arginine repetitive matrix protein 2-like [Homarus americanus]|uniref:serine/arginine repetitive matrix protein 2-like n=1 Tax=Homarus americanus TaxID=6706 RepID=UPI001C47C9F6|nr:serine/arginine repetitive matrix protein 2-like [Homarus americanus]